MYECLNCGGNLKFDIARQQLYCEYCNTTADPYTIYKEKDAEESIISMSDNPTEKEYRVTVFTCPQCGGQLVSEDTTAATFCSFCGSSTILDSRVSRERRPGLIIPFMRTEEDCRSAYAKMMRRALFVPKELKNEEILERFRGIYMPYWIYCFEKRGEVTFSGEKSHREGDYVITDHYRLECGIEEEYRGLAYDASASFSDHLSNAISPFDLRQSKAFTPSFLSGFYADTSDVESSVYRLDAEDMVIRDGCKCLSGNPVCRKYHVGRGENQNTLRNAVRPFQSETELAMLPVWFLAYRSGERVGYAVVNGQTGRSAADLPVDLKKYLSGSMLLALPIFVLLNLFLTITPVKILLIAALLALVCIMISNVQVTHILARESGEDDKGFSSVHSAARAGLFGGRRAGMPQRKKTGSIWGKIGWLMLLFYGTALLPGFLLQMMKGGWGGTRIVSVMVILLALFAVGFFCLRQFPGRGRRALPRKLAYTGHFREKWPVLVKPFAGIVAAAVIFIVNPVSDEFYYLGAFGCMCMVLWALMDIIKQHNMLTTRKLPQFNRRGGDEIA
ncbi:MAG: hypothetical protein HFH88_12045 [Lachnospiraceae bacterium]|jgi:DNA-directed RNA polymerase subunit RPC12/RpoP|nr:hypothetical protein [Lachnospiraceae bacterium]